MEFAAEKAHDATSRAMVRIMAHSHAQRNDDSQAPSNQPFRGRQQVVSPACVDPSPFGGDSRLIDPNANIGFAGITRRLSGATSGDGGQDQDQNDNTITTQLQRFESDPKLYQGNAWELMYFQRIMVVSLMRLLVFIRKLYEDFQTTKVYQKSDNLGFFVVSLLTMLAPTIVFTLYRICRYLQQALPKLRLINGVQQRQQQRTHGRQLRQKRAVEMTAKAGRNHHSRSATPSHGPAKACQSPSPTSSQYVDCATSQTGRSTQSLPTTTMSTQTVKYPRLSPVPSKRQQQKGQQATISGNFAPGEEPLTSRVVDVNKLGDLPDPESTRIVLGAGEQIVHGVLFVFWQLKRQVDVIGYLVERSCLWRKASQKEIREVEQLRTGSDGLEWFQDFYAAFIAIILQVYSLGALWLHSAHRNSKSAVAIGEAVNQIGDTSKVGEAVRSILPITHSSTEANGDSIILTEIIISSIAIFSLLIAVRRKDDGSLTLVLSMVGWGSLFAARIIIIALSFVHLGWKLTSSIIGLHLLLVTGWVYKIAIDSHNNRPSETEAFIWQDEQDVIKMRSSERDQLESGQRLTGESEQTSNTLNTDAWMPIEHVTLITQILTLFAIPSLFYWPVMFNLRKNYRTPLYLCLIMSENLMLIVAVFATLGGSPVTTGQLYLLAAAGAFTVVGFIFISLYLLCKPVLTDYMVRADQLFNGGERVGIYFELCSRVFKMPDLSSHNFRRLMNQIEEQVEL